MLTNRGPIRATLCMSTALLLAPVAATAAELTYIETESLEVGDRVFLPDAVAFNANGQSVTCAEVAFHVAKSQAACFAALTEEDIQEIWLHGEQGRNFTTASGLSFAAGPEGIVGLTEDGESFAVAGASPAPGDTAGEMTDAELAGFLGLDSAGQLGGAQAGLDADAAAGTGGVTASADTDAETGDVSVSVSGDADTDSGGVSASADADADTDSGGVSASADADAGGGGVSADAGASADAGGVGADAGVSAGVE